MGWQEIAVALIVCGAVTFLVRRAVGRRRRRPGAQTFVPLSQLKRSRTPPLDRDAGCH